MFQYKLMLLLFSALSAWGLDKIVVATGRGAETDAEVVAFPNSNSVLACSKPRLFPRPTEGAVGNLVDGIPVLCGGRYAQNTYNTCFQLDPTNGNWFAFPAMATRRGFAASAHTEYGYWVTGGRTTGDTGVTSTTELYSSAEGDWRAGPPLAQGVSGHCAVALDPLRTLVLGGDTENSFFLDSARIYDWTDSAWTDLPQPMFAGRSQAACAMSVADNVVVVAGGYGQGSAKLTSVEVLDLATLTWSSGPALPVAVAGARLLENAGRLFLVGGETPNVYGLEEGGWTLEDEHLVIGNRLFAVAIGVDDEGLFQCS